MMARRTFQEKLFDADPRWLGPKYPERVPRRTGYADPLADGANKPATAAPSPPEMMTHLRRLERQGQITVYEHCQVAHAEWKGEAWKVCCDNHSVHNCLAHQPIHRIWLATGIHPGYSDPSPTGGCVAATTLSTPSTGYRYWMSTCAGRAVNCFFLMGPWAGPAGWASGAKICLGESWPLPESAGP